LYPALKVILGWSEEACLVRGKLELSADFTTLLLQAPTSTSDL